MVVLQKLKEAEITEQDSLLLTRNLLRIAIYNISYIRGIFPENYFNDKSVPALEMKIKKLMPMDAESRRLIDWMEKGVYDALQKKYLKTMLFCICETADGPTIEEYSFSFSYSGADSDEVSMNITRNKKHGGTFKSSATEITPNQMRSSACKMIRTLVQLMRTLDRMPDERTILMKLLYYDDVTPADYEPPFFRGCSGEEANNIWTKSPLKMEVGNINSKHILLALKVKSILDPCDDEERSLGADSVQEDDSSTDCEVDHPQGEQYIVEPIKNCQPCKENSVSPDDETQDPEQDEENLELIRNWIASWHSDNIDTTDILSNFPDLSLVLLEEIINKLVKQGFLTSIGRDSYRIHSGQGDCEMAEVKVEEDMFEAINPKKYLQTNEDNVYAKALYHALGMEYISVAKLQQKLEGQVCLSTTRKLIEKMTLEGFVEVKSNGRLGKRVIHSDVSTRKLEEIKKALGTTSVEREINGDGATKTVGLARSPGSNHNEQSICGGLHSIGSDLTRTRAASDTTQNGADNTKVTKDHSNTPISNAQPVPSRESAFPVKDEQEVTVGMRSRCELQEASTSSRSTQEKRLRKASTIYPRFFGRSTRFFATWHCGPNPDTRRSYLVCVGLNELLESPSTRVMLSLLTQVHVELTPLIIHLTSRAANNWGMTRLRDTKISSTKHILHVSRTWDSVTSVLPKGGEAIWGNLDWSPDRHESERRLLSLDLFSMVVNRVSTEDWSLLPLDLLNMVANRLGISRDFHRFKAVCSSWKSAAEEAFTHRAPQFLGLMLPGDEKDRRDFYSPLEDKVYKNLLPIPDDDVCRGNRDGWLITASYSTKDVCVLRPLSGDLRRFPSLHSLESLPWENYTLDDKFHFFYFLVRAILSANPSQSATGELVMMVIFGEQTRLAYAKEGGEAWVLVEKIEPGPFLDIIHYNNEFYAVNQKGAIFVCDIECSVPTVRVVIPSTPDDFFNVAAYLVESCDGELLLVSRLWTYFAEEDAPDHLRESEQKYETIGFEVYKLDLKNQTKTQIDDLGDQSLFLDVNTSLSIPSPENIGLRKNCIYYTDDFRENNYLGGNVVGVFDLETEEYEIRYSPETYVVAPQPMWFSL
ncbi:hypothetical protein H6P81_008067 [Aristolochia fimbriata]|uniref:HORMA domain-containing protein n=1 Tax=Aristolochia fimbriata TaxID=158543 RepID=A0AAV7F6I4_ARIFI|nr:hypothetical protein H6P81_008067 [Aristolochia fimbriata]